MKFIRTPITGISKSPDHELINLEHIIAISKLSSTDKTTYTIKFYGLYDSVFFWDFHDEIERDRQFYKVVEVIWGHL